MNTQDQDFEATPKKSNSTRLLYTSIFCLAASTVVFGSLLIEAKSDYQADLATKTAQLTKIAGQVNKISEDINKLSTENKELADQLETSKEEHQSCVESLEKATHKKATPATDKKAAQ